MSNMNKYRLIIEEISCINLQLVLKCLQQEAGACLRTLLQSVVYSWKN